MTLKITSETSLNIIKLNSLPKKGFQTKLLDHNPSHHTISLLVCCLCLGCKSLHITAGNQTADPYVDIFVMIAHYSQD